jgi:bile acid-coenzyme A ligase
LTRSEAVTWHAARQPDRLAIACGEEAVTRAELEAAANRTARAWAGLGVRQGDLVTIALPNGIEFYVAVLAAWRLGATPAPISSRLPRIEREAIVELADPALVVGVDPDEHPARTVVPAGWTGPDGQDDGPLVHLPPDPVVAITSGGSTGRPKLILQRKSSHVDPMAASVGMQVDGVQLVAGPTYHNGPFTFSLTGLHLGSALVVMPRFDAGEALRLIERHRVDWLFAVPTMFHRIWQLPAEVREAADLSSVRAVFSSGSPWPAWLKEAWIGWIGGDRILESYGGAEQFGGTMITGTEPLTHPGSVGRPTPGTQIRILNDEGQEVAPGEIGEVYFLPSTGAGSTYEYVGAEGKRRDGWETLGDLGHVDGDGYLYLVDRRTDMIVSGGANVYPAEVEGAIEQYPAIRSSAVIGLPDDDLGNVVHAIVDTAGVAIDPEELRAHLRAHLAPYKVPRSLEFVDEPLRDDAGKVRRSALRAARMLR